MHLHCLSTHRFFFLWILEGFCFSAGDDDTQGLSELVSDGKTVAESCDQQQLLQQQFSSVIMPHVICPTPRIPKFH
jgi:hypothetical protein